MAENGFQGAAALDRRDIVADLADPAYYGAQDTAHEASRKIRLARRAKAVAVRTESPLAHHCEGPSLLDLVDRLLDQGYDLRRSANTSLEDALAEAVGSADRPSSDIQTPSGKFSDEEQYSFPFMRGIQ